MNHRVRGAILAWLMLLALRPATSGAAPLEPPDSNIPEPRVYSALPECTSDHQGLTYAVIDSSTQTAGETISGGGAYLVTADCDGSVWKVRGAGSAAADVAYDTTVDITGAANPCALIQAALKDYNEGVSGGTKKIRVTGSATFDSSDTFTARARDLNMTSTTGDDTTVNAPVKYCIWEVPTATFESTYLPVVDGTSSNTGSWDANNRGAQLYFDNVELVYDATGQTVTTVGWMRGGGWIAGYGADDDYYHSAFMNNAMGVSGRITIRRTGDADANLGAGVITGLARSAGVMPLAQATSFIGVWINGAKRADMTRLSMGLYGLTADNDDVGFWHDWDSGTMNMGRVFAQYWGIARLETGKLANYSDWYATANDFGRVFGDALYGDLSVHWDGAYSCTIDADDSNAGSRLGGDYGGSESCAVANQPTGLSNVYETNATWEGNSYGESVMFTVGSAVTDTNVHIEQNSVGGAQYGHGQLIGAGYCPSGTRTGKVAGVDADCTGGAIELECGANGLCTSASTPFACCSGANAGTCNNFTEYRMDGGTSSGDKGWVGGYGGADTDPDWGGLTFGECASETSARFTFANQMPASTTTADGSIAFQFSEDVHPPQLPQVDVSDVYLSPGVRWPAYERIVHRGSISIPFSVDANTWNDDEYVQLWGRGTAGLASSDPLAWLPLPKSRYQDSWQIHHISMIASEAHTAETSECSFVPACAASDLSGIVPYAGAAVTWDDPSANNGIDSSERGGWFEPDAAVVCDDAWGSGTELTMIGLSVSDALLGGSGPCDHLSGNGVLTLLPVRP